MYDVKKLAEQYEIVEFYRESDVLFSETLLRAAAHAFMDSFVVKYEVEHEHLLPSGMKSGMTERLDIVPVRLRKEGKQGESLLSLKERLNLNTVN